MDLLNLLTSGSYIHKSFLVKGTTSCEDCTDMRLMKRRGVITVSQEEGRDGGGMDFRRW